VQEVFLLNITPESSHEKLVLQLLLDPSTDMSVIARHFGLGLVGSKFILSHFAIHKLKFTLFGSSVHFIFNEKLGLASTQSDVDLGVIKSAEAGLKAVKQWADNHCSFAKHAIQGQMRVDSVKNQMRGSLGPHVKSCSFFTLDETDSFEVQFVELNHFWSSDPRVDFDVCCLRVRNTAAAGELSLIDFQLPPSISIASIRENVISKRLQILKPPSGKRLGKYLERGWKISKRVNFRLDGTLVHSLVATLGLPGQIGLLTKACMRNY
jgi:hypothetical protein